MRKLLKFREEIPTFCVDQAFILICLNSILLLTLSISLFKKSSFSSSKIRSPSRRRSPMHIFSLAFNCSLGLADLFLGIWNLENRGSLAVLFQGFAWVLISFFISSARLKISRSSSKLLSAFAILYSLLIFGLSVRDAVLGKPVSAKMVLDALFLPGSILLFFCSYKGSRFRDFDGIGLLLEPLIEEDEDDGADSGEKVSNFAKAGFFSKLAFWWLNPVMKRGWEKTLEDADVPKLRREERSGTCHSSFLKKLNEDSGCSILNAILLCVWKDLLISGLFALVKILTVSAGPLLLNAFISVAEGHKRFEYEGYALVAFLFFCKILESLSQRHWFFRTRLVGLRLRSLLTAAIYGKQLRLSNAARLIHRDGEIMNYATVDAYRVGEFPFWFHQLWTTSLNLCIAFVILFRSLGPAAAAAITVIILTVLLNVPIAKYQHKFQTRLMVEQDKRLKASTEALSNIKVLKLYSWDARFKSVIEKLRNVEYRWLRAVQLRKAYNTILFSSSTIVITTATLAACYFLGVPLNAGNFFTFLATLRIVQNPIRAFPDVIMVAIQANVAFNRIVKFLEAEERPETNAQLKRELGNVKRVSIKSASFSWELNGLDATIKNISLEIKQGEKVAVCGATASGKSTLLAAILGEIPIIQGKTEVHGRIAYVSQTAWTQTGTIRENILFGSVMEENRYKETIEKCCLVKDLDMLPNGDQTEIGGTGVSLSGGQQQRIQLARALYKNADLYLLDDPFSAVDAHTAASLFKDYVMGALEGKTVLLVTHQVDFLPAFDSILFMSQGEILQAAPYQEMLASSEEFQDLVNAHRKTAGSGRVPQMTGTEKRAKEIKENNADTPKEGCDRLIKHEEKEKGHIGLKPYIQYLNQNNGFVFFFFAAFSHLTITIVQMVQKSWMAANLENDNVSMLKLILIYLLIGYSTVFFLFTKSLCTVGLCMRSSQSLFSRLLSSLFAAPMAFYDSTPLGRILSRVSNDLSIVDLDLPFSIIFVVGAIIDTGTTLGLLSVVTWQVLLVCIPMVCLALFLQRYYFTTAKELMRINGTTKSLVANHLAESMAGAMTIRAFGEEDRFFKKNLNIIDTNASPFFHSFTANEWLVQRLETLSAFVLASSALFMVLLPQGTFSSGFIGLALSYGLSLNTSLILTIQNHCYLANNIISVERLNQYMNIPKEAPQDIPESQLPSSWPAKGRVEISDLQIRYRPWSPLVLKGINCTFEGGQKIGIVGRTGSGKSTLINALFRLVEPEAGKILIDGIDISKIGLHDLRSRLAIIPQHPTLFTGTVRFNLDPLSVHSDAELWEVLDKCQLTDVVRGKTGDLDSPVEGEGSNWSMGQRQLFCLGRALLKKSRILVLDEATASVDNSTDLVLQRTIRREFADCTVITVAHRIPTIMDCSMVLSISNGEVVEYEEPMALMKKKGSLFGKLVNEYWSRYDAV